MSVARYLPGLAVRSVARRSCLMFFFLLGACCPMLLRAESCGDSILQVMSWNVENFFDCHDDPQTDDDEFTPTAARAWSIPRYRRKIRQIAEGICRAGEWDWPDIVALIEVENDSCMTDLLRLSPLGRQGYDYGITHTPDRRGLNVALLFRRDRLRPIETRSYSIILPGDSSFRTRSILHLAASLPRGDTLDIFAVHFPSRRGGAAATTRYRNAAAARLRGVIDSVALYRDRFACIVMGDFNGNPDEEPTAVVLGARPVKSGDPPVGSDGGVPGTNEASDLYNLFIGKKINFAGSYCFRNRLSMLDQIIASRSCIDGTVLSFVSGSAAVVVLPDAAERDVNSPGRIRPRRTYAGPHYRGGPSDHFPVRALFRFCSTFSL